MAAVARSPPPPPPNKPRKTALLKGGTQAVVYAAPPASAQQLAAAERERDRLSAQLNELRKTYEEDKREILAFGREAAAVKERLSAEAAQLRAQLASGGGPEALAREETLNEKVTSLEGDLAQARAEASSQAAAASHARTDKAALEAQLSALRDCRDELGEARKARSDAEREAAELRGRSSALEARTKEVDADRREALQRADAAKERADDLRAELAGAKAATERNEAETAATLRKLRDAETAATGLQARAEAAELSNEQISDETSGARKAIGEALARADAAEAQLVVATKDREALEARFAEARFAAAEAAEGVAQMQAEVRELNLLLSKAERDKEGAHKERNSARATLAGVEAMLRGEGGKSAPASQSAVAINFSNASASNVESLFMDAADSTAAADSESTGDISSRVLELAAAAAESRRAAEAQLRDSRFVESGLEEELVHLRGLVSRLGADADGGLTAEQRSVRDAKEAVVSNAIGQLRKAMEAAARAAVGGFNPSPNAVRKEASGSPAGAAGVAFVRSNLEAMPFFAGAPEALREGLAASARVRKLTDGATVCRAGDASDTLYIVGAGAVDVEGPPTGISARTLLEGSSFGAVGAVLGEERAPNVRCRGETVLYEISHAALSAALASFPAYRSSLVAVATKQKREQDEAHASASGPTVSASGAGSAARAEEAFAWADPVAAAGLSGDLAAQVRADSALMGRVATLEDGARVAAAGAAAARELAAARARAAEAAVTLDKSRTSAASLEARLKAAELEARETAMRIRELGAEARAVPMLRAELERTVREREQHAAALSGTITAERQLFEGMPERLTQLQGEAQRLSIELAAETARREDVEGSYQRLMQSAHAAKERFEATEEERLRLAELLSRVRQRAVEGGAGAAGLAIAQSTPMQGALLPPPPSSGGVLGAMGAARGEIRGAVASMLEVDAPAAHLPELFSATPNGARLVARTANPLSGGAGVTVGGGGFTATPLSATPRPSWFA